MAKERRLPASLSVIFGAAMIWGTYWPGSLTAPLSSPSREIRIVKAVATDLQVGASYQLEAGCWENAILTTLCNPYWETSDDEIVTVSQTGVIELMGEGLAVICVSWSQKEKDLQDCLVVEIQREYELPAPSHRPMNRTPSIAIATLQGAHSGPFFHAILVLDFLY